MKIVQAHQEYDPRGIYYRQTPDPQGKAFVEGYEQDIRANEQRFLDFVDTAPNLNDTYADELASVHDVFAAAELDIAPVVVLDAKNYAAALTAAGETNIDIAGAYLHGRALVREQTDAALGKVVVLGNALHEAAHSTARGEAKTVISSKVKADVGRLVLNRAVDSNAHLGFVKPRREDMEVVNDGNLLEEAFADLTRVRFLSELGREPKADGLLMDAPKLGVKYAGEGVNVPLPEDENEMITIPIRFAAATAEIEHEGRKAITFMDSPNGIAAYGLDLLDKEVPGLYKMMQDSRKDPTKQRDVIQMIESVKPGLYRELRVLPYNTEGFKRGLVMIGEAIRHRRGQSEHEQGRKASA